MSNILEIACKLRNRLKSFDPYFVNTMICNSTSSVNDNGKLYLHVIYKTVKSDERDKVLKR